MGQRGDALDLFLPIATRTAQSCEQPYAVLTLHRAANTEPDRLRRILGEAGETSWTFGRLKRTWLRFGGSFRLPCGREL